MSKCERKMIRKFTLETEKSMHSVCPTTDGSNKKRESGVHITLLNGRAGNEYS